jgi:hypothetical protein
MGVAVVAAVAAAPSQKGAGLLRLRFSGFIVTTCVIKRDVIRIRKTNSVRAWSMRRAYKSESEVAAA